MKEKKNKQTKNTIKFLIKACEMNNVLGYCVGSG